MKIGRNSPCWCLSGKKYKQCHEAFDNRLMSYYKKGYEVPDHDLIKVPVEIEGIKEAAKINMACLDKVADNICEGMTTQEIDDIVSTTTKELGGICAPLNYDGFPKSVCTSVNDQVCHGIPSDDVVLKSGDIINVDCTTILEGYYDREDQIDETIKALYIEEKEADKGIKAEKKAQIKALSKEKAELKKTIDAEMDKHANFNRIAKPLIVAERLVKQAENYTHLDDIAEKYEESKKRSEEERAAKVAEQKRLEAEKQAQKEKRLAEKSASKK